MHRRAKKSVEQHVAIAPVIAVASRTTSASTSSQASPVRAHAAALSRGVIRLHRADGEERVAAARKSLAEQKLELAHLVPATAKPHDVVALHEQPHAVQLRAKTVLEPMQALNRRRPLEEEQSGKVVERHFSVS